MTRRSLATILACCTLMGCHGKSGAAPAVAASSSAAAAPNNAHSASAEEVPAAAPQPNVRCTVATRDDSLPLGNVTGEPTAGHMSQDFYLQENESGQIKVMSVTGLQAMGMLIDVAAENAKKEGKIPFFSPLYTLYRDRADLLSLEERLFTVSAVFYSAGNFQVKPGYAMKLAVGNSDGHHDVDSETPLKALQTEVGPAMVLRFDAPYVRKEGREGITTATLECTQL